MNKSIGHILKNHFKKSAAFTIIELVVSIVIIGILTSIAVVSYPGIKKQMTISQMNADLRTAATQLSRDFAKNGKYPDTKEESSDGKGLTAATGTTFAYEYNSTINTYCLSATNNGVSYYIDAKTKTVTSGLCPSVVTFAKSWGNPSDDISKSVISTSDGGYAAVGYTSTYGAGSYDAFLSKYTSDGSLSWTRTWGGSDVDYGFDLVQSADGDFVIIGNSRSYGLSACCSSSGVIAKYSSSGSLIWNKTLITGGANSYDNFSDIIQTKDGGYAVVGTVIGYGSGDIFIAKYTPDGVLSWGKSWGDAGWQAGNSIVQTADGGYLVGGSYEALGSSNSDALIVKFSPDGTSLWAKTFGGSSDDELEKLLYLNDGGYLIAGNTEGLGTVNRGIFIAKYSNDGTMVWSKKWDGGDYDYLESMVQSSDGGVVLTGDTFSFGAGMGDVYLSKISGDGTVLWTRTWGDSINNASYDIVNTPDGGYVVVGGEAGGYGMGSYGAIIAKFRSDGTMSGCVSPMCQSQNVTSTLITPNLGSLNIASISRNPTETNPTITIYSPNPTSLTIVAPQ